MVYIVIFILICFPGIDMHASKHAKKSPWVMTHTCFVYIDSPRLLYLRR